MWYVFLLLQPAQDTESLLTKTDNRKATRQSANTHVRSAYDAYLIMHCIPRNVRVQPRAVASGGGAVVPGPPFHVWPTGCCTHPILYFKNVAPSGFRPLVFAPPPVCYILATGLVQPHQVIHCFQTSMPCLENICIDSFTDASLHRIFFIRSLQSSNAFYKSSFFILYLTLLYDGDLLQQLLLRCLGVQFSPTLPMPSNVNFLCASWHLMICFSPKKRLAKHLKPCWKQFTCFSEHARATISAIYFTTWCQNIFSLLPSAELLFDDSDYSCSWCVVSVLGRNATVRR